MLIRSVYIKNFRAIRLLDLQNLTNAIVIAGPNGCGKSSIFDAIRFVKSIYGEYFRREQQAFFQEFEISGNDFDRICYDPNETLHIKMEFELTQEEKEHLHENARDLLLKTFWQQTQDFNPIDGFQFGNNLVVDSSMKDDREAEIQEKIQELMRELQKTSYIGEIKKNPQDEPQYEKSLVLELVFSLYQPGNLGVIEYNGANRYYVREQVGGIDLHSDYSAQRSQNALYNTENKYRNIKTEMANSYIKEILARQAGESIPDTNNLDNTIQELFKLFFPNKKFRGIIPDKNGRLTFPVVLENGREHDINELSSGEKEIILGYLRLRNNAPRNSIILLDEPELHLNPRLVRNLPRFYNTHLGTALNNQIWLITHSDVILRGALDESAYCVYHMQSATPNNSQLNQAYSVSESGKLNRVLIDLVGVAYSPSSKVVFIEGKDNSNFDTYFIRELFPDFAERVNLVTCGNKFTARSLNLLLDEASKEGKIEARFYSIVDRDYDGPLLVRTDNQNTWDVYHIENYLLNTHYLCEAINKLIPKSPKFTEQEVEEKLINCALKVLDNIVKIKMNKWIHDMLIKCLRFKFAGNIDLATNFKSVVERSSNKMQQKIQENLTLEKIIAKEEEIRNELNQALENNCWTIEFQGKDILLEFTKDYGLIYEQFCVLLTNIMKDENYQPPSMKIIIDKILNS